MLAEVMAGAGVDGQGEGLGGVRVHAVAGRDGDRVGARVPEAGVPARVAVPSPLSTKVTPPGSVPVSVRAGGGVPVAVTVKVPDVPSVKVASGPR